MISVRSGSNTPHKKGYSGINWRINTLAVVILLLSIGVFLRLFYIAYLQHDSILRTAEAQYKNAEGMKFIRGQILIHTADPDKKLPVAAKNDLPYAYAVPKASQDAVLAVEKIISALPNVSKESLYEIFSKKDDPFEMVQKTLSEEEVEKIEILNLPELKVGYETGRVYPQGTTLSHVIGFLGFEGDNRVGQYGIENYYDQVLADGGDVVLTIDHSVQSVIETNLDALMKRWSASGGTVIVQDTQTGAILGMASSPSFDPNSYSQYPLRRFINPAIQDVFEPGSTFKSITMAGGLDAGLVSPNTTYTDTGEVKFGSYTINNFDQKKHGIITMTQVLEKSLNTGAVFVEKLLGPDRFMRYVSAFGFGKKTGIQLAGEVSGNISNLNKDRDVNSATASFGQGISMTPIQLVTAYSAIANGGKLLQPFIVDQIRYANGKVERFKPSISGVPISEKTSAQLKEMLVSVVEKGFDKARVPGYDVAAKTGTAQIAKAGGYSDDFIHDMVGFAPAFSPKFTLLIKLDKPQGINFAADSLSPAFREIAKFLLRYYNIPPTRPAEISH